MCCENFDKMCFLLRAGTLLEFARITTPAPASSLRPKILALKPSALSEKIAFKISENDQEAITWPKRPGCPGRFFVIIITIKPH